MNTFVIAVAVYFGLKVVARILALALSVQMDPMTPRQMALGLAVNLAFMMWAIVMIV